MAKKTVLVVGASGLVGTAAVDQFLDAGDSVIAVSRRRPEVFSQKDFTHIPLDLRDRHACEASARAFADVTHVVYAAVHELPGLLPGWSDPVQMDTNLAMLANLLTPLAQTARNLRHVSLMQGTKAYGAHLHTIRIPSRECEARDPHKNFYWLQEDFIREHSAKGGWAFSIWRPQLIVGPNYGVVMNIPPVIGAYAAIRRELGRPFSYPGGADWAWEAVDTRLVAQALVWASDSPQALGQTFNLTNGEVFSFRDMWPAMARTLGVATGPDEPLSMAKYLLENSSVWNSIVRKYGLRAIAIEELCGESHHYADMCFNFGQTSAPPATFLSTVKIRQAGFNAAFNTEESFCHWLQVLQQRKIIPAY